MLKPSAQYALLYSSNVLAYQLPTLLMQRILGPATVSYLQRDAHCLFDEPSSFISGHQLDWSGDHDYFRQRDWRKLHKLYEFSERIILLLTTPITFGSMLATPLLLQI